MRARKTVSSMAAADKCAREAHLSRGGMSYQTPTCSCGTFLAPWMMLADALADSRHSERGNPLGMRDVLRMCGSKECCRLHIACCARNARAFADTAAAETGRRVEQL